MNNLKNVIKLSIHDCCFSFTSLCNNNQKKMNVNYTNVNLFVKMDK
jgi:hypothetical protein